MALVTLKEVLSEAVEKKYAVGAFPSFDLISADAAISASAEKGVPLILLWSSWYLCQVRHDPETYFKCLKTLVEAVDIPITIIVDHGSYDECMKCIEMGVPSVMFDGSSLPLEENIAKTREIVEFARKYGVSVEGEIGHVGGNEGDGSSGVADSSSYTDPEEAARFARETGVDALAVAIGTVHGVYQGTPCLDIERLKRIREMVGDLPLVMHGGSGLPDEQFKAAIDAGINKINFVTNMEIEASEKVSEKKKEKEGGTGKKFTFMDAVEVAQKTIAERIKTQIDVFQTKKLEKKEKN